MSIINFIWDFILHSDQHLGALIGQFGSAVYIILFIIVLMQTGFILTSFLPGDSLLFAVGAFASRGSLSLFWLLVLLCIAAIVGDIINYWTGHYLGTWVFNKQWLNKKHLDATHEFYKKHGKKTIILARFVPIIRTFAPFVAGVGSMTFSEFLLYNIIGGLICVGMFVLGGYYFGGFKIVQDNFSLFILGVIIVSLLPIVIEIGRHRWNRRKENSKIE